MDNLKRVIVNGEGQIIIHDDGDFINGTCEKHELKGEYSISADSLVKLIAMTNNKKIAILDWTWHSKSFYVIEKEDAIKKVNEKIIDLLKKNESLENQLDALNKKIENHNKHSIFKIK